MLSRYRHTWRRGAVFAGALLLPWLLGSCQQRPDTATVAVQPTTAPVRNIGNFSEALRCMDNLLWSQGKKDIYITSAGLPDATGRIAAGTKEMLITAISKMSATSGAFRFVDYDPTQLDVQFLSELVGIRPDFVAPSYYLRGAITQLDSSVLSSSESVGLSLNFLDLGVSRDQVVSVMSMDLNVGKLVTRQILPGMSANNSIAVVRSGRGADAGGLIGKAGLSLSVSLDRSEGLHQAARNLVELSTIEALGKLTRVPYWQCLSIEPTNPTFKAEGREWFDTMSTEERERFVKANLVQAGYYREGDGSDLGGAVAHYQADNDLIPSGRIDFDLYYRMLANTPKNRGPVPGVVQSVAAAAPAQRSLPRLFLSTSRGPKPKYRVNETMTLQVQPTEDAFVYCYYQDVSGAVARIFPNRFQPDAFVPARRFVEIPPGSEKPFNIRFDSAGAHEVVGCLASDLEFGVKLPDALKAQDLEPLPVQGIDDVAAAFRGIAGARVDDARLVIEVSP